MNKAVNAPQMNDHAYLPTLVTACGLILLMTLESWLPAAGNRRRRLRHVARNMTLWLLNALALALLAAPSIANVARWTEQSRFGLLNLLSLPPPYGFTPERY